MSGCCWRTIVDQNHEPKDGLFCNVIVRDPIQQNTWIYDSNGIYSEGTAGKAATITVGTTTTGEPGTDAKVENVGDVSQAVLNFTIPRGDKGDKGDKGDQGDTGSQGPQGEPGPKGETGEPFQIKKIYDSVEAMNADYSGSDVAIGEFVLIDTGNVEDPDDSKLYVKGNTQYDFVTDLSGAQGIQGPQGNPGTPAGFGNITATVDNTTGTPQVSVQADGPNTAKNISFSFTGLKGEKGDKGDPGLQGEPGQDGAPGTAGAPGAAATITVGETTTGEPGTQAAVTNSGTSSAAVLNFTIPKGSKGDKGDKGDPGDTGSQGPQGNPGTSAGFGTPTATVDQSSGTASVVITASGPDTAKIFNFAFSGLKGAKGDTGDQGPEGPAGQDGARGSDGQDGAAATVAVGTTTTGEAGTQASVTNSGSASAAVFNFTIPKGEKGGKGDTGPQGPQGDPGPQGPKGDPGTTTFAGLTDQPTDNTALKSALDAKADTSDVHNATITVNAYGAAVGSFTVNQAGNTTINIPEPTVNLVVEEI